MSKRKQSTSQNKKPQVVSKEAQKSEDIPVEVAEIIKDLPKEKGQTLIRALSVKRSYSGPLPDGESIKIYDEVIPNVVVID